MKVIKLEDAINKFTYGGRELTKEQIIYLLCTIKTYDVDIDEEE